MKSPRKSIRVSSYLVSVVGKSTSKTEADPVMAAFSSYLSADISRAPERVKPLAATRIEEARKLTKGVKVRDDEALPDDVTL